MNHLPKIVIDVIPHKKHRYPTVGDYYKKNGELHIRVSKMNDKHEFLVAVHELIEWFLTQQNGVSIESIDKFDIAFEKAGKQGEPGDDPTAPYFGEHQFATDIEYQMADKLGVNWEKYSKYVDNL